MFSLTAPIYVQRRKFGLESRRVGKETIILNFVFHLSIARSSWPVTLKDACYRGSATLKQTDFGITPVTVAGGTVKVKDEVKIEFEIALVK
jgi:hypothetical protein